MYQLFAYRHLISNTCLIFLLVGCSLIKETPPPQPSTPTENVEPELPVKKTWLTVSHKLGISHSCAIDTEQHLYCWGDNKMNQLGIPNVLTIDTPTLVNNDIWLSVSTEMGHTCAINSKNELFCWGLNNSGQLGKNNPTYQKVIKLKKRKGRKRSKTISIPESYNATLLNKIDNKLWKSVSTGTFHTCAIDSSDQLFCWGSNDLGQLGNQYQGERKKLKKYSQPQPIDSQLWKSVNCGHSQTCAINNNNQLHCWGWSILGQVASNVPKPSEINGTPSLINADQWKMVSIGARHVCAININNELFCWGNNDFGQLGDGTLQSKDKPTKIGVQQWLTVETNISHTCAITMQNELFCWGQNEFGQLGDTLGGNENISSIPSKVGNKKWENISLGSEHTCGINSRKELLCWGWNSENQLGFKNNDKNSYYITSPRVVELQESQKIIDPIDQKK